MENFILYEELGAGSSSVVYKGRRKGNLNYVAIICADKAKRTAITNHVRLSQDLDHPNIVGFYEWYETSNHLWLVVELCTGGSLESVIGHDGCLSEDVVRRFGWDLVKGLKHIHELGIIFSDLTPAKILLDGSGTLKFGNFCLSKADGETLEDLFTLLSTSEEAGEGDTKENFDNTRKRLHGPPTYKAPEVLQGSETNMISDFWALGCTLYYMYTGTPPFYSDNYTEMTEMILHQEPPSPRQTASPPSEDFQNLLKGLLNKNPDKSCKHLITMHAPSFTCVAFTRHVSETRVIMYFRKLDLVSLVLPSPDNVSELRPKSGMDEDNTEAIFLLRYSDQSICCLSTCFARVCLGHRVIAVLPGTGTDIISCVKALLHTDFDLTVTPIMDNPKILKSPPVRFDPKILCVPSYSVQKLQSLSDEEWTFFLLQLCSSLEEQNPSAAPSPHSTATRSRLNLLCYLCCVVGHKVIANRLMNSTLVGKHVLRVMGLLALHCTELGEDSLVSEAVSTLIDLLRDNLKNNKIKQFLLPPLGEMLYLIASQEEKRGSPEGLWFVPAAAYTGLMRSLREGDDSIVHHMAAKAIENISTAVSAPSHHLVTTEIGSALWYLFTHSTVEAVRVTAISALSRLTRVVPAVFLAVIDTCGPAAILEGVGGAGARVQQHLLTAMATALLTSRIQTHRVTQSKDLVLKVLRCLESPSTVTRAKALLLLLLLIQDNTHTLLYCCQHRLVMHLERDLRKATPLRENPSQSGYLSQCLDLLIVYLSSTAPLILEDVLCALQSVVGRRHPSTAQSRQLKHTLPTISVVLELLSTQSLLQAAEPIPLYALKLLVSMTEHSMQICRLIKHSKILPTVFQLIMANSSNVTSGMVQNVIALLCNLSGDTVLDLEPLYQQGLIEVVVSTLSEAALVHLDGEGHAGRKISHLVLQALLELLHNILKQTSVVVRSALQLSTENQDVWEESIQCLSLLVQLYGGEGYDCLSPSCLQSFSHVLRTHMHTEIPRSQRTTLRIIKRLVSLVWLTRKRQLQLTFIRVRQVLTMWQFLALMDTHTIKLGCNNSLIQVEDKLKRTAI
uniref:Unc-51 like kinase 4 n=1 Tax=Sander lucioperca TaxID=283035 RepID=A0A8C9ZK70_SANLU